ncbi:MAG: restriction endonuclease [Caldilineaceae bacterium]|nr:restriction endonuclease [Caldilineaceae bacterium]
MPIDRTGQQSDATPPPVVPNPEFLPLRDPNFSWERFEAFCEEFISRLPGVKETHRYGRTGSRQRGIDIIAYLENGEKWAFQCKQKQRFTETDATRAIQQTSYSADFFVLTLSCQATSGVRDVCENYPDWDVWDVGDISRKVRELEMHSGARLVEAHFGASLRKEFLGLPGFSPFVTPVEFFRPFLDASFLFNHAWALVGRSDHLRQVHQFVESKQQKVAILAGRGGIGKSKILHALAETFENEHKGTALWFAAESVELTPDGADYLPFEPCVVIVDDAHRRDDLPALLALSRQRPHVTKLLLSCRPQAIDYVKSQVTQGGFHIEETVDLPDVKELSREEIIELARQALGPEFSGLAELLAAATWDCPLVTVVGGQLLAKKAIAPELLERDEEFRGTVLTRFRGILIGKVSDRIDTTLCTSLLDLIAAVQPIRLDNLQLLDREAEFLGVDRPKLLNSLDILETAGVLLRRGYTLRIVPDVLADHILHQANVTTLGLPTGYAELVFDKFASLCPVEVLRNLSELDWRLRQSRAQASDLLNGIWQRITQRFQDAPNLGRSMTLDMLGKVAVFQPERTLELVEYTIRNPATELGSPEGIQLFGDPHSDVVRQLPPILRQISYTLAYLPRCCNLLWELGRDDNRNLHSSPDHGVRVLADLGGYEIGKPLVVTRGVLDAIENLLKDPSSHDRFHSPLDIIDPMLAKTGLSVHVEGHNFVYKPFTLTYGSIKSIRQRAISLIGRCLLSSDLRTSLRALKSLESAFREPQAYLNMEISDEDRDQWRPEQLEILALMADLAQRSTEPVTLVRIREVLWVHCSHVPSDEIRDKADAIVSDLPDSFELRLTQELMPPYDLDVWRPYEERRNDNPTSHREKIGQMRRALVVELLGRSEHAGEAYEILTGNMQTVKAAGVRPDPHAFLGVLGITDPEFAADLCDIIVDNPNGPLAPHLQSLLTHVRIRSAERARDIDQRVSRRASNILSGGLALSYRSPGWADNITAEDIEATRVLLDHEDIDVRGQAIGSLSDLAEAHPRVAIDLAKGAAVGDNVHLAKNLCQLFSNGRGIPFRELTSDDLKAFISKLEDIQEVDDYFINNFLVKASEQDARAVADLLLTRVRKKTDARPDYRPLPILGFRNPLIGFAASPDQESILREIRDTLLEPGSSSIEHWMAQLFREVSLDSESAASLKVLNEWINSGSAGRIESAARLVAEAPPAFVFRNVEFTANLQERAYEAGSDCYRSVASNLRSSALSGTRSGTPGQPKPEDVTIRNKASAVKSNFDAGSPPYRFYDSLVNFAEASIKDDLLRDEEQFG